MKKEKTFYLVLLGALIIVVLFGCNAYKNISTNADVNADFSKYKTFAWLPDQTDTSSQPYNNEIIRNNIRNYVGQNFAERGYKINLDTPDVLLRIIVVNKKKEKEIVYSSYPWPYYYCRYYYGSIYYFPYDFDYYYWHYPLYCYPDDDYTYTQKYEYLESSIILNVIDRKQNKLVWSGTAQGDIYDTAFINENIHPAVEAIMREYPIKPIKKSKHVESDDVYK